MSGQDGSSRAAPEASEEEDNWDDYYTDPGCEVHGYQDCTEPCQSCWHGCTQHGISTCSAHGCSCLEFHHEAPTTYEAHELVG